MSALRVGQQLTLTIENLSFGGGRGIARHQGFVVFVPFVLPQEVVRIEIEKLKKSFGEARLIEIISPSPYRTESPCPHFQICGGCTWQHIQYSEQVRIKENLFKNFLRHYPDIQWEPTVASSKDFHYRNRIQIHKEGPHLGFHQRQIKKLVPIEKCLLAEDKINEHLRQLHQQKDGRYEVFLNRDGVVGVRSQNDKTEAQLFSQVNTDQNEKLVSTCIKWIEEFHPKTLLELYCGSGNFTFSMAQKWSDIKIIAIDGSQKMIDLANNNNPFTNVQFVVGDLNRPLSIDLLKDFKIDFVLLDPPRTGCSEELLRDLANYKVQSLLYISCNPSTLARDLKILSTFNYVPRRSQVFDMFPQTDHMESMTLVTRL